jgi:hypothetical protein
MSRSALRYARLLLATAIVSAHAGSEPVTDGLRRCSRETDERARLACFDGLVSALPQIATDQLGMTAEIARKRDPDAAPSESPSLSAKISALRQASRGEWIFTLDNGQQWIQAEPQPSIQFRAGEAVRIEHGALGSLWLAADHHRKTRVKRLQ